MSTGAFPRSQIKSIVVHLHDETRFIFYTWAKATECHNVFKQTARLDITWENGLTWADSPRTETARSLSFEVGCGVSAAADDTNPDNIDKKRIARQILSQCSLPAWESHAQRMADNHISHHYLNQIHRSFP